MSVQFSEAETRTDTGFPLADNEGSIRDIVNASGTVIDHMAYDAYGNITSESDPSEGNRFKFQGMAWEAAIGLYYDNARYYDPATGRFTSQDPTGFAAGDANLDRFVGNDPVNFIDPSGLASTAYYRWLESYYLGQYPETRGPTPPAQQPDFNSNTVDQFDPASMGSMTTGGFRTNADGGLTPSGTASKQAVATIGQGATNVSEQLAKDAAVAKAIGALPAIKGRLRPQRGPLKGGSTAPNGGMKPGSLEHKAQLWQDYKDRGGDWTYERWSKQYDVNMQNPKVGLGREAEYRAAWGGENKILKTPFGQRQVDVAISGERRLVQLKTGHEDLTTVGRLNNSDAIKKDAWLVQQGYSVEWVLEKGGSKPLIDALNAAGIKVRIGSQLP